MSLHDWIAAQITKHDITSASAEAIARSDQTNATRLIDSAGALQNGRGQAFGLEIPPEGIPSAAVLVELCLHAAKQWGPVLEADSHADLGRQLERLGLPPIFAVPAPAERVGLLALVLAAEAEDDDEEELKGAALARLHDVEARADSASMLADLPCIQKIAGPWLAETGVRLVHCEAAPQLRCELAFAVTKEPAEEEVLALVRAVEDELLYTSWALNLDWTLPDDVSCVVHVRSKVLSTRFERVSVD